MPSTRSHDRWSLRDVRRLHIRAGGRRACHTHGTRGLGVAVSVVGAGRRVLVSLHGARGILLRRKWIAGGTAERSRGVLSVWRGHRAGAKTRGSQVGWDLLELRRWPAGVGTRGRSLERRRGCEWARRHMVRAIVLGDVPTRGRLGLAVVAERLLRVCLHRSRREGGLLRWLLGRRRRRLARGRGGRDVIVQHAPEIHLDLGALLLGGRFAIRCLWSISCPTRPRLQDRCSMLAVLLLQVI
jgi:hypothetical protein